MKITYRGQAFGDDVAAMAARHDIDFVLARDESALFEHLPGSDALWITPTMYTKAVVEALAPERRGRLRWVGLTSAGFDILARNGRSPDLVYTYAEGVHGEAVAEHAVALLLALVRGLHLALANQREAKWDNTIFARLRSLEDMTVAIAGLGSIGSAIARRLQPLAGRLVGVNRTGNPQPLVDRTFATADIDEALGQSDAVIVATTFDASTRNLIDANRLAALRPGGYVVNVSRGGTVDTDALYAALQSGRLGGAALDVTDPEPLPADHPLWSQPNAIVVPHAGSFGSLATGTRLAAQFERNLPRFAAGAELEGTVPPPNANA